MNTDMPSVPVRQAALLAHGLPREDRDWLLGRLEPAQRGVLAGLLRELQTLSIPPDHDLLEQVLRDYRPAPLLPAADRLEQLDSAGVARLVSLLRAEPPSVAARLLRLRNWPWRSEVAAALGASSDPADADTPAPTGHALDAALVDEVAAALVAGTAGSAPVPASGRWTEMFRRKDRP
jgi:hypothetical protein